MIPNKPIEPNPSNPEDNEEKKSLSSEPSSKPKKEEALDAWLEKVVSLGKLVGLNEVKTRWKLLKWQEKRALAKKKIDRDEKPVADEYFDKIREEREKKEFWESFTATKIISVVLLLCFVRSIAENNGSFWSFKTLSLIQLGSNLNFDFMAFLQNSSWDSKHFLFPLSNYVGEWYRLFTSVLLHAGLMHIGFNVYALLLVGPYVEEIFGKVRMVAFFVVTGLFASFFSSFWDVFVGWLHLPSSLARNTFLVGIGASGALMGLIGVAAGWTHRDQSPRSLAIRNTMLQWVFYTVMFGFLINGDNVAHLAGFGLGFLLGYALFPFAFGSKRTPGVFAYASFTASIAVIVVSFLLVLAPPVRMKQINKNYDVYMCIKKPSPLTTKISNLRKWCECGHEMRQAFQDQGKKFDEVKAQLDFQKCYYKEKEAPRQGK